MSSAENLVATIILHRIRSRAVVLSEAQAGCRSRCSSNDQIMSLQPIGDEYQELNPDLFICYVDFQKAFDSVWGNETPWNWDMTKD